MVKKRYFLIGTAGIFVVATMIGKTFAAFQSTSAKAAAQICIKNVGVTIYDENLPVSTENMESAQMIVPGQKVSLIRNVKNTQENGYDVYVKVVINKTWTKPDQTEIALSALEEDKADILYAQEGENVESLYEAGKKGEMVNDWIVWQADQEQIVMFYTKPLSYNETTENFLSGIAFHENMDSQQFAEASYTLEYEVTAVQANNAKDAIAAELGVFAQFDSEGKIVHISETRK